MKKMKECADTRERMEKESNTDTYTPKKNKKSGGSPMKSLAKKKAY